MTKTKLTPYNEKKRETYQMQREERNILEYYKLSLDGCPCSSGLIYGWGDNEESNRDSLDSSGISSLLEVQRLLGRREKRIFLKRL